MQLLLSAAIFVLMISVGMSLQWQGLIANWRSLTWSAWLRLLLATFILPPAVVLLLGQILPLDLGELAGLFLVAAVPGAPLLTRNLARRGFDMHLAASYQVWSGVMVPFMIPLVVFAAAKLYSRNIWIPPRVLALQIVEKEFLPLLVGMALMRFAPAFSTTAQRALNLIGNAVLTIVFVVLLWTMRGELRSITLWVVLAVFILLLASIASVVLLFRTDRVRVRTLAVSNANRHVGLALLLSGRYMHAGHAIPVVACYAVMAAVLLVLSPAIFGTRHKQNERRDGRPGVINCNVS
jgi:predicted Na+-dependent transporter